MTKVGIDISHGNNTFPPSKGFYKDGKAYHEHSFSSKLGIRLKEILESHGIEVIFAQQPNSRDIPLGERGDIYSQEGVDLVVSLHANWNNNRNVNGRCFFYWHSDVKAKKLATLIKDEVKKAGYSTHGNGLHESVRGTWTDLYITRALPMTSVLGEHGFMGGNKDFNLVFGSKQKEYVEDMAIANAKGITTYLGISYKGASKPADNKSKAETYYRVQVGAFEDVANVASFAEQVERKTGYDTYITEVGGFLKVQIGAFKSKSNAENRLAAVKNKGYNDAFITTESGAAVPETEPRNDHTEEKPKANLVIDGYWGPATTRALQRALGTTVDGVISGQYNNNVTSKIPSVAYGPAYTGSRVITTLQRIVGGTTDGWIGPQTVRKLQRYLGTPVDGVISKPSLMVKELQRRLNAGTL